MPTEAQKLLREVRRQRLKELVEDHGGAAEFVRAVARRLEGRPNLANGLTSYQNESYVSRALKGKKSVGEGTAAGLEELFGKPKGWLSASTLRTEPWPFEFPRSVWDGLKEDEKRQAERQLLFAIQGLYGERPSKPSRRRA